MFDRITKLCKERGLSISRLEKECGLGNATIRGWKKSMPNVENLKKVADRLGCTVDDLIREQDEKEG